MFYRNEMPIRESSQSNIRGYFNVKLEYNFVGNSPNFKVLTKYLQYL